MSARRGRVAEAMARGDLAAAAEWEAAACDRDGYDITAELIRRLAAAASAPDDFDGRRDRRHQQEREAAWEAGEAEPDDPDGPDGFTRTRVRPGLE